MSRSAIIGLLIAGLLLGGAATLAQASDSQWVVNLKLYYGSIGSGTADEITFMGVRPGATDGYDLGIDTPNPLPPPPGDPYVDLYFYRSGWGTDTDYAEDFRSTIVAGVPKTWEDVRATSSDAGDCVLTWTIGLTDWEPPADYMFVLYDEGTTPNPTGGTPHNMRTETSLTFAHAGGSQVHYFHIEVYTNAPPTCSFTYSPPDPVQGDPVSFDGTGSSDPDGTVVGWAWDFGDGGSDTGSTVTHSFVSCGVLTVALTVTDNEGATATCSQSTPVQCNPHLDWNCQLKAYWGALDGAIKDEQDYMGVRPAATDNYDSGLDAKKPGEPFGDYVYAWFNRPTWGQGAIMHDWRSALTEGTSKVWGDGISDTWNIKTNLDQGGSGVYDECSWGFELPLAAAVYLTWEFGVSEVPPAPLPPDEYMFTLQYKGGINPKPTGTAPGGVSVPTLDQTWDMETTSYITIPLWNKDFQPPNPSCTDLAAPDTARFKIIVTYPAPCPLPVCCFTFSPAEPQVLDVVQFTDCSTQEPDEIITDWAWDFGDGGTSTAQDPTHQYAAAGPYTVSLTVTNNCPQPRSATCTQELTVYGDPTCSLGYSPDPAIAGAPVDFTATASDPDGGSVVSADWDFGDGGTEIGGGLTTSHTYAAGTYTVTCTVHDDEGATGTCTIVDLVVSSGPPSACFTWTPCAGGPPLPEESTSFDGSCSTASSTIVSYDWDFGDGNTDTSVVVSHSYAAEGTYTVALTVTDSEAQTDTYSEAITVEYRTADLNWNCQLKVYWGALDGEPYDLADYIGSVPGATDGYDLVDAKKPGEPFGDYVYAWFNRPTWGQGPIMHDWRSPVVIGTSKIWGTGISDTWNIKTNLDQGPSGVFDDCGWSFELPMAAAIYVTWEFGVTETPPAPLPPDEYEFTLQYKGGINPKPTGSAPVGVTVPTLDQTWDMETTTDIVIPLWNIGFQPPNASCTDLAAPDTARFKIIVNHPGCGGPPTCDITVAGATECATELTFNANASDLDGTVVGWEWDFGDGGTATGDPAVHVYGAMGTYTVTCVVTDNDGMTGTCETTVTITSKTVSFFLTGPAWHMVSIPCEPLDPDPAAVFDELDPWGDPSLLSGNLHRFDPINKGYKTWYNFTPGDFGGPLQVGEGYWLWVYNDVTITYEACCGYGERVLNFPVAGWYMIGHPQFGAVDVRSPGMEAELGASGRIAYCDAVPVWIGDPLVGYNPAASSYYYVTCGDLFPDHALLPFEGYWADVKEAGLTVYVPPAL